MTEWTEIAGRLRVFHAQMVEQLKPGNVIPVNDPRDFDPMAYYDKYCNLVSSLATAEQMAERGTQKADTPPCDPDHEWRIHSFYSDLQVRLVACNKCPALSVWPYGTAPDTAKEPVTATEIGLDAQIAGHARHWTCVEHQMKYCQMCFVENGVYRHTPPAEPCEHRTSSWATYCGLCGEMAAPNAGG